MPNKNIFERNQPIPKQIRTDLSKSIKNQIKFVEAGAQGEHKLSRGYLPQKTWSAHWIKEKEFSSAINKFLDQETRMINIHKEDLEALAPYKN